MRKRPQGRRGGYYMDQFTYAERATDWRGNNNIAESIFDQLSLEEHPIPEWIVVGAGTGGTSATIGRYLRYNRYDTRLAVVDPENSAFYPAWRDGDAAAATGLPSRIEGIGRPRSEPSFVPAVIDHMIQVPDAASVAAMRHLRKLTGLHAGPSTGTNLWGVWQLVAGDGGRGPQGQHRFTDVRRRRSLRGQLQRRRMVGRARPGPGTARSSAGTVSQRRGVDRLDLHGLLRGQTRVGGSVTGADPGDMALDDAHGPVR